MFVCIQAQLKDSNLSAEETARAKAEQASKLRDMEKKVRTLEQDLNQAQEVQFRIHQVFSYIGHLHTYIYKYGIVNMLLYRRCKMLSVHAELPSLNERNCKMKCNQLLPKRK